MEDRSVLHSTFVIERSFPARVERVFTAFADTAKKRRWFAEGPNKEVEEFEMDFRVGGVERARYHYVEGMPFTGVPFVYEGTFQEILPDRYVVNASTMTFGGKCISASLTTIGLMSASGTKVIFTFQGAFFEGADGPQIREAGWVKLLDRLAAELSDS